MTPHERRRSRRRPSWARFGLVLVSGFSVAFLSSFVLSTRSSETGPAAARASGPPVHVATVPLATVPEAKVPLASGGTPIERPAARKRRRRVAPPGPRYGSREAAPVGWIQSGPSATRAPNPSTQGTLEAFARLSCVSSTACPDGQPLAIDTGEKRDDVLRGLVDDRVVRVLLRLAEGHDLAIMSFRSSHSPFVQDGSGRPISSNHALGRAADIRTVDGAACVAETSGMAYEGGEDDLSNPAPSSPTPCLQLAREVNALEGDLAPTETIFYWDVGGPSGVSLENHEDHVHIGFNAF